MTPLTVFYRTLMKSSAVFLGAGWIMLHPSLDWRPASARSAAGGWNLAGTGVTAQKSPTEAAIDGLVLALKDTDPGVRRQAAAALGQLGSARAVPGLVEALKDAQADVRLRATGAGTELAGIVCLSGRGPLKPVVDRLFERRATERTAEFAQLLEARFGGTAKAETASPDTQGRLRQLWRQLLQWLGLR